ncbi:Na/Pi cotransporter family protein [Alteromonas sp. AMM-1]|uniref:Na/Pi cotransporter family protein n=1 Tax=Alteromonas sp. AMM-1 TaxID=3394233 RepID=UPI0039A43308
MDSVVLAGSVLGGLGLFLLAISMMTDGLKLAAGSALRHLLSTWSKTPLRGVISGFTMTALVQSSSAVTVASLGFVNAGLISMRQALGIIYGSNIGTTITGWLVAIVGFKLNIQTIALPLVGLGMLFRLLKPGSRFASVGLALVGFGLFFVGVDILKNAFEGIVQAFDISQVSADGISGILLFLVVGFVMTVLTQSSSASIALTITAATSGVVGIYAAGAMVIGANIGTTSTALLASIGATANAKRVAAAQVTFNVATAIVALLILPVLFYIIHEITAFFQVEANNGVTLAIFHTVFNVLGVLLIFPVNDRFAAFLDHRFTSREEQSSKPQYLDKTIAQTPDLAVNAIILELLSTSDKYLDLYQRVQVLHNSKTNKYAADIQVLKVLSQAISEFIVSVESAALSKDTTISLATMMRVEHYLLNVILKLENIIQLNTFDEHIDDSTMLMQINDFQAHCYDYLYKVRKKAYLNDDDMLSAYEVLRQQHEAVKADLILSATRGSISVAQMAHTLDKLAETLQIGQMWMKAFSRIQTIENNIETLRKSNS